MIDNIKSMWSRMLAETKHEVVQTIMKEFGRSKLSTKQNWIYEGMIPEEHQPRVVEICQNALKLQMENTKQLV